jgi:type VI secretion system protein VasD
MLRSFAFSCAAIASLWTTGCGGPPPPAAPPAPPKPCQAVPLTLALTATERTNALSGGEGRPVQVRIYQLKSDARLRTASFEDVWQNEAKALEGEVVSSEQHTIFPGQKQSITVQPKPDAAFLGVVALFREPQGKDWFLTYEIAPPKSQPPCPQKADPIPLWLDRMQLQDGTGRENEPTGAPPATAEPAKEGAGEGH